ncbi:MAG: hypothetical protein WAV84_12005 [Bacteroidota bacterium]
MHRLLTALLLLLLLVSSAIAQDDEDFEIRPNRRQRGGGIVGGGGGITPTWHFLNTTDLNSALAAKGMPQLGEDGLFLFGGQGYAYIMIVPNLRVGGMGYAGSVEAVPDPHMDRGVEPFRKTELSVGAGGLTVEYVIPFGRFHIAVGGMLGAGSYTLTLTQNDFKGKTWGGLFPSSPTSPGDTRHEISSSFFTWQPSLTMEYEVHSFVVLGVTGGYFGGRGSWELDKNFDLLDVPEFNFESPFVRLGLTFGLFLGEN